MIGLELDIIITVQSTTALWSRKCHPIIFWI